VNVESRHTLIPATLTKLNSFKPLSENGIVIAKKDFRERYRKRSLVVLGRK